MKLTNYFNLPQPVVDAVRNDPYSKGDADYSITGLLESPRVTQLRKAYDDVLSEDVSDRIYALMGQVMHGILERAERTAWAEKRFFMEIGGVRISGQVDRLWLEGEHLSDYKNTGLWKVQNGIPKEFEQQVNCYVELVRSAGFKVSTADITAFIRDWKKRKARTIQGYPAKQVMVIPVPIWPREQTQDFLFDRIKLHEAAKTVLPLCTDEARWKKPDEYAVYKAGSRRAVRVYDSQVAAEEHCRAFGDGYSYAVRKGDNLRCEDNYCLVAEHCSQWAGLKLGSSLD